MSPDSYIRSVHAPLSAVIHDVCDWEGLSEKKVFQSPDDLRALLKNFEEALYEKRNTEEDVAEARRLDRLRICARWLRTIFNLYSHRTNGSISISSLAVGFASAVDVLKVDCERSSNPAFLELDDMKRQLLNSLPLESEQSRQEALSNGNDQEIFEPIVGLSFDGDQELEEAIALKLNIIENRVIALTELTYELRNSLIRIQGESPKILKDYKRPRANSSSRR